MKKILPYLAMVLVSLNLTSCFTAQPIVILEANNAVGSWFFGQQVIRMEEDGIDLSVAYERESPFEITMNLRVINRSNEEVLVDPQQFLYRWYAAEFDTIPRSTVRAENPELRLRDLDYNISANQAAQNNKAIFDLVATTAEITADVVAATNDWSDEDKESLQDFKASRREFSYSLEAEQAVTAMSLNQQRELWSRQVLRKTTLPPGGSMDGKVIFKPTQEAKRCRFYFPIGKSNISIDFKQSTYTKQY